MRRTSGTSAARWERPSASLERILFFDDTRVNVDAAAALGMPAVHVRSLADIADRIAALSIMPRDGDDTL
jgi:FMN phosphatase YigB (HAD superfamily)